MVSTALRRERQRSGCELAFPAETAETRIVPQIGSKRMPTIALRGLGFCQAQSQLTHGPPSFQVRRYWRRPQASLRWSWSASQRAGSGLRWGTASTQFSPQCLVKAPRWCLRRTAARASEPSA